MSETIFVVEHAAEGRFSARARGESIFTQAEPVPELHRRVRDAVRCHLDEGESLQMIRLRIPDY
jgi:hypothetical protein